MFEAPDDLGAGFALSLPFLDVFTGAGVVAHAVGGDAPEGACLNWCGSTGGDGSEERALPFWGGGFLGGC